MRQEHRRTSSVWSLMNHTCTPPGRRFLKHALVRPIICSDVLNHRYRYCHYLLENDRFSSYSQILKNVYDIERFHRQMNVGTLLPRTFAALDLSYTAVERVVDLIRSRTLYSVPPSQPRVFYVCFKSLRATVEK